MNEIETFYGLVENTLDALRIFQMCQDGRLNRVRRRLHERERRLIRSGSVFVFDEEESGIRRWTDGRLWSPSRILGNFLIYRELERKGTRVSKMSNLINSSKRSKYNSTANASAASQSTVPTPILPKTVLESAALWTVPRSEQSNEMAAIQDWLLSDQQGINPRDLQPGSSRKKSEGRYEADTISQADPMSGESLRVLKSKKLSNNHKGRYVFKVDGLIKKTISIQLDGHTHHLVAYYSLEDFCKGHLKLNKMLQAEGKVINPEGEEVEEREQLPFEPALMEMLRQVPIPVELMMKQNFRKPAAFLASATANTQGILAGNPDNGEKLITALEYGAINPSDLQYSSGPMQTSREGGTSNFVPGGGIIFSSSTFAIAPNGERVFSPRPRRHSSFHPSRMDAVPEDNLSLIDESSQLTGEALEFLSQYSPEQDSDELLAAAVGGDLSSAVKDLTALDSAAAEPKNLETELFGTIFENCKEQEGQISNNGLRGDDVLLTEFPV